MQQAAAPEPQPEQPRPLGYTSGKTADLIRRFAPFAMFLVPCTVAEGLGLFTGWMGTQLIQGYLLRAEDVVGAEPLAWLLIEAVYWLVIGVYLMPVFRANHSKVRGATPPRDVMLVAQSRIYNYPPFLILATWGVWMIGTALTLLYLPDGHPKGVYVVSALLTTVLNAMLAYYGADLLNRYYIIPDWFADGEFRVKLRLRRPALMHRFVDLFVINGLFPIIAVCGVIFIAWQHGPHDADEMRRVLIAAAIVGSSYCALGLLLTYFTARTFSGPLDALEEATDAMRLELFSVRVAVQSDDQLGRLQRSMNSMASELARMKTMKTLFGHYVSPEIRDLILDGRIRTDGGERIEAVVLFSDIRSFTELSERHAPEALVNMLNIHFSRIVRAVSGHNGFVDKFIGDAVMAVFDAEFCGGKHIQQSMAAALQIMQGMAETNQRIAENGFDPLSIGIGMACGPVIRGNVGSDDRRELTVMGDTVNTASRLEAATKTVGHPLIATRFGFGEVCAKMPGLLVTGLEPLLLRGKANAVEVIAVQAGPTMA